MSPHLLLVLYCVLILSASLFGWWVPALFRLTHTKMQLVLSVVAGFMLGVGVLHLLPHALFELHDIESVAMWILLGFLAMFFIERFFCFHHHDVPPPEAPSEFSPESPSEAYPEAVPACPTHSHDGHDRHRHGHQMSWGAAAIGLTIHSLIWGIALAASVRTEAQSSHGYGGAGLAVFLIIFLHQPFDSITLSTLMTLGRWSKGWQNLVNALYALTVPMGVALFYFGWRDLAASTEGFLGYVLAFSAGTFLCISMSDLLPELQFHQHDRLKLSTALVIGLALAWGISWVESKAHDHGHHSPVIETHDSHPSDPHDSPPHNDHSDPH